MIFTRIGFEECALPIVPDTGTALMARASARYMVYLYRSADSNRKGRFGFGS
jgi:ADP-heptose:LPS heptosyltransferase